MTTGPMPMGMICCDTICAPPCPEECTCTDITLPKCIPAFQVKFEGLENSTTNPCADCPTAFNSIWFQLDCATDGTIKDYILSAGSGCEFKVTLSIVRTPTLFRVLAQIFNEETGGFGSVVLFFWDWVITEGQCVDFSNTTGESAHTITGNNAFTFPCKSDGVSALLRWVP